jgi:hypothetical protein
MASSGERPLAAWAFPSTPEAAGSFMHELPEKQKGHKAYCPVA